MGYYAPLKKSYPKDEPRNVIKAKRNDLYND